MKSNLESIYAILLEWFSRFEGVHSVSITMTSELIYIQVRWINGIMEREFTGQYSLSRHSFESYAGHTDYFEVLEKNVQETFESQHMRWEVGED